MLREGGGGEQGMVRRKAYQEHPEGLFLLCKLTQPQKGALSGEPLKSRTETAHFQKKNCSKLASCVSTDDIVLDQVHVLYVIAVTKLAGAQRPSTG